jgi:hypothetical protein
MSCKVNNCRHKYMHVTSMHQCGSCKLFGHGQMECGKHELMNNLKIFMIVKLFL